MKKVMRFFSLIPANLLWVHLLSASIPVDRDTLSSQITAGWGDLVFSEVMFDPDPPVKLPAYEYLEVLNRTGGPLSLSGWSLGVNSRRYLIPGYTLPPGERAILTSDGGIESFGGLPHLVRVFTSGYALPNEGALLSLYNAEGLAVHAARYQVPRGVSSYKTEGGWSLESPDDDPVCLTSVLWDFSVDPSGGTPGAGNSTVMEIIDNEAPVLLFSSAPDRGRMRLTFSEPVWSAGTEWIDVEDTAGRGYRGHEPVPGMLDTKSVMLMPGGFIPDSIVCCEPTGESVMLHFPAGILPEGGFILVFSEISDCAGNLLEERQINLGMPGRPEEGLMLINEVMYDPWEGDPEFIELLVRGSGYLDLADYAIGLAGASIQDSGTGIYPDDQAEPVPLSYDSRLVGSGDHLLVSQNIPHLADRYRLEPSGRWIQAPDLGVLPNSGGRIYLTDRAGNTIDRAPYGDDMHAELLGDTKGVSLERISPDRPGSAPENWHSAASIEGYSTPGRPNSQSIPPGGPGSNDGRLVVEPRVFSPDNDGYQDLLEIRVETGIQGYALHIRITDTNGIPVRYVADNHLAGPFISYTWDGEGDDGRMSAEGIYVVHLEAWHPVSGDRITERAAVGLIYP